jgi:hypothetical protein
MIEQLTEMKTVSVTGLNVTSSNTPDPDEFRAFDPKMNSSYKE